MPAKPTSEQLTFKFTATAGVTVIRLSSGEVHLKPDKILLRGSVRQAAKILGGSVMTVYRLIEDGEIRAWKPRNTSPNCKYVVDMTTVYELQERRVGAVDSRALKGA